MTNNSATYEHNSNKTSEPTLVLRKNPWKHIKVVGMYVLIGISLLLSVFTHGQWGDKTIVLLVLAAMWLLAWWEVRVASIVVRGDTIETRRLYNPSKPRIYKTKDITAIDVHGKAWHWLYGPTGRVGWLSATDWSAADMRELAKTIGARVCDNPDDPGCPGKKVR